MGERGSNVWDSVLIPGGKGTGEADRGVEAGTGVFTGSAMLSKCSTRPYDQESGELNAVRLQDEGERRAD